MEVLGLSGKVRYTEFENLRDFLQAIRQADEYQIEKSDGTRKPPTMKECERIARGLIPKEKYFQTKIINYLKEIEGSLVWKEQSGYGYQISGLPDVCCIISGQFYGFEVKRPLVGVTSEIQRKRMEQIANAGGVAAIVSYVEDVKKILNREKSHEQ